MSEDNRVAMQRVRVGLTGLGAVLLIVAVSAAIFETARQQPVDTATARPTASERTVANMMDNETEAPADPLTEIGVTPSGPAPAGNAAAPAAK
jgi:hypothetical protein